MTLGALKLPESAHSALAVALRRVVDLKVLRSCRREMNIDRSNITLQQAEKSSVASLIAEAQLATTTEGSEPQSDGAAVALKCACSADIRTNKYERLRKEHTQSNPIRAALVCNLIISSKTHFSA